MQFVKSSVYQAEITEGGVREREVDTRSREEVELQERLRKLPEFSRNPNFKSHAEQIWEGIPSTTPEAPPPSDGKPNPNLPHSVTEEEFEFYEALRAQDRRKKLARQREEDLMRTEFHKAREASLNLTAASVASSGSDRRSAGSESNGFAPFGKPSPFAALGPQKLNNRVSSPLDGGCIFDVTTKVFKEKQQKRALDARPTLNLVIKKPRNEEATTDIHVLENVQADEDVLRSTSEGLEPVENNNGTPELKEGASTSKTKMKAPSKVQNDQNVFALICEEYADSDDSG